MGKRRYIGKKDDLGAQAKAGALNAPQVIDVSDATVDELKHHVTELKATRGNLKSIAKSTSRLISACSVKVSSEHDAYQKLRSKVNPTDHGYIAAEFLEANHDDVQQAHTRYINIKNAIDDKMPKLVSMLHDTKRRQEHIENQIAELENY